MTGRARSGDRGAGARGRGSRRPHPGGRRAWIGRGLAAIVLAWAAAPTVLAHPSALERVARLDSLIRSRPDDPRLYVQRAQAHAEDGHFDEALSDLRRAAALGQPVDVAYDLGVVHHRMGRLEEARADFDRWLARHPGHAPALLQRAQTLRELGDRDAALADYQAYFERHPKPNPGDYLAAARMLATPDGSDPAGALAVLDAGLRRLGTVPTLQREAIALERTRGHVTAALDRLETLRPSLGASPDWKVDRGELLLEAGRRDEGRTQLEAARAQLSSLRVTQARVALGARIEALLETARNGPPAPEVARTSP